MLYFYSGKVFNYEFNSLMNLGLFKFSFFFSYLHQLKKCPQEKSIHQMVLKQLDIETEENEC